MAMGKRKRDRQPAMWVRATELPAAASRPFYRRLNQLLRERGFDDFAEAERDAVYANRRRIRGERGQRLLRRRGELLERPCTHLYETGGFRRLYVRGRVNVLKRLLVHAGAFNLGLWMGTLFGVGTPRGLQGRAVAFGAMIAALWALIADAIAAIWSPHRDRTRSDRLSFGFLVAASGPVKITTCTTGS
jgi:hypothetical protein